MMRLDLVSYTPAEVWRRPEGWRMKAKSAGWWRDKVAALCWRILHRLKAVEAFQYTETIYRYGEVEQGVVTDLVKKGICTVLDQGRDPNDYCIVVGAKDFSEIMRDMPVLEGLCVPASSFYCGQNGYRA